MQCPHRWPPGRPAAIPITYRHRARGRPACCCARPCPWRDSPNRPTPESPRCPTPDAACARSNRHSPNSRPCPIRRRWTTRRRGRAGTIRRSRWRRTAACARLPAAGQSPRRHRRAAGAARRPERQRAGPGRPARGRRPYHPLLPRSGLSARALYLPPQEIRDGVVDIAVQEGVYDEIQLDNRSRVSDAVLRRGLSVLRPGDPVHIDNLESRLLRLSDLPGAAVQARYARARTQAPARCWSTPRPRRWSPAASTPTTSAVTTPANTAWAAAWT